MVSYANEQIMYESMMKQVDKAETFVEEGMQAYASLQAREVENLIKSKSSQKLTGHNLIGTYPIKKSIYNSTDCVAVVKWSAEGVTAANQSQSEMNNTTSGSSGSSNQDGQDTTSSQTPSDDF